MRKFIDIGANITDAVFRGLYHGSQKHVSDFNAMLGRAKETGVEKIIITGGSLEDSRNALELAKSAENLFSTVGCHPTRCNDFEKDHAYLDELIELAKSSSKIVAVGEFGLDYDRTNFCPKETQLKYFETQFGLAEATRKPLFLHCRSAAEDFTKLMKQYRDSYSTGVVHSFDGSWEQASTYLDMGLYIGINGCSLKTEERLDVVKKIPNDRLMIETDCPYCDIKPTHASYKHVKTFFESKKKERFEETKQVKGRNEPQNIVQVLEVIAAIKGEEDVDHLASQIYENTCKVFFQ
ncbi:putative deoxyribonuclease TATDN1 [Galendromus occidentalis]|uniref:Deoxyribonuclease TATDN1 n=1 Tax=Galendromus occidentalis TaxID=34638 RepID=A0AAJ6VV04_9ACAR|nr:putative deoxyribonuclease TATDN1 [Galendromus occidentalis]